MLEEQNEKSIGRVSLRLCWRNHCQLKEAFQNKSFNPSLEKMWTSILKQVICLLNFSSRVRKSLSLQFSLLILIAYCVRLLRQQPRHGHREVNGRASPKLTAPQHRGPKINGENTQHITFFKQKNKGKKLWTFYWKYCHSICWQNKTLSIISNSQAHKIQMWWCYMVDDSSLSICRFHSSRQGICNMTVMGGEGPHSLVLSALVAMTTPLPTLHFTTRQSLQL